MIQRIRLFGVVSALVCTSVGHADVLPEQRVDLSFAHSDAGGDQVSGPAFAVTHRLGRLYSVSGLYEVERVKAADVDLAAPGTARLDETRQLGRFDLDVRDGTARYSVGVSRTSGPSKDTSLVRATITQSFFHDLTTLTVGASKGWDKTYRLFADSRARDDQYSARADRRSWWVTVDQIVTPRWRVTYDGGMLDQSGDLSNPNLGVRFRLSDGLIATGTEVTPSTRSRYNSALHARYSMGPRGTWVFGGNYYYDSWGVRARAYDVAWLRSFKQDRLGLDLHARRYSQGPAKFYRDLADGLPLGAISRDRSLADHEATSLGAGLTWQTRWRPHLGVRRWSTGMNLEWVRYQYTDFRDNTDMGATPGSEPFYRATGLVAQVHLTGHF
jgi:Protein of unknown function (DUF3570)